MSVLIGNNELHLNIATLIGAIRYWLEGKVLCADVDLSEYELAVRLGNNEVVVTFQDKKA